MTDAWRAVVPPNPTLWIGLLAVFEATVGVLVLSGGRRTQLGYAGVIAFYRALWLFGWFETVWVLLMVPALVVLLLEERRAQPAAAMDEEFGTKTLTGAGVWGAITVSSSGRSR